MWKLHDIEHIDRLKILLFKLVASQDILKHEQKCYLLSVVEKFAVCLFPF